MLFLYLSTTCICYLNSIEITSLPLLGKEDMFKRQYTFLLKLLMFILESSVTVMLHDIMLKFLEVINYPTENSSFNKLVE